MKEENNKTATNNNKTKGICRGNPNTNYTPAQIKLSFLKASTEFKQFTERGTSKGGKAAAFGQDKLYSRVCIHKTNKQTNKSHKIQRDWVNFNLLCGMFLCIQAFKARDSMAKSLYGALFDWIILHINHAMFNRRDMEESVSVSHWFVYLLVCLFNILVFFCGGYDFSWFFTFELFIIIFFSVCPSVCWICLDSRTSRPTASSSCASTTPTRNCSFTSTTTSSSLNKCVEIFSAFCFCFDIDITFAWTSQNWGFFLCTHQCLKILSNNVLDYKYMNIIHFPHIALETDIIYCSASLVLSCISYFLREI